MKTKRRLLKFFLKSKNKEKRVPLKTGKKIKQNQIFGIMGKKKKKWDCQSRIEKSTNIFKRVIWGLGGPSQEK